MFDYIHYVQSTIQPVRFNQHSKGFLKLVDKYFPKSSILHKIFNRNSVKVNYSCMQNYK